MRIRTAAALLLSLVLLAPRALGATPNDPDFASRQWNLPKIGAPTAWDTGTGVGIVIAVADTGIDAGHPDLAPKVVAGRSFTGGTSTQDDNSHGSHVAGIAAAATGNGIGVAGTAPDARLMPVKVLDADGTSVGNSVDLGIRWAADNGAAVINLSLGGFAQGVTGASFTSACEYAWSRGSVCVAAAGNEILTGSGFANDHVVVVSATDPNDAKPTYSSGVGAAMWGIAAPGGGDDPLGSANQRIWSTVPGGYGHKSGTSMAAPHVSGALAVLRSLGLGPQAAVDRMLSTARDIGASGRDSTFGSGRLDLAAAVAGLSPPPTTTTTTSPGATTTTTAPSSSGDRVDRLAGADRMETAIAVSRDSFPAGAGAVVVARADTFADALAGTPLAVKLDAPLLLTARDRLDGRTRAEIDRLLGGQGDVHLLGGEVALTRSVEAELAEAGYRVSRHAGADRFETAVRIAGALGNPSTALLADGLTFADGLIAGAAAPRVNGAVLLTAGASMHRASSDYLAAHPGRRIAVGRAAADADRSAERLAGADAPATSRLVAEALVRDAARFALASAFTFPDALSGGAHVARARGALLLTDPRSLSPVVEEYLRANRAALSRGWVYGGPAAVADEVRAAAERAIA